MSSSTDQPSSTTSSSPFPTSFPDSQITRDSTTPRSPASSFASKESFLTAVSTPPASYIDPPNSSSTNPTSHLSPQASSLRKSVSVDSFVHYPRELHSAVVTRPFRGNTGSALEPPRGLVSGSRRGLYSQLTKGNRGRGESLSSVGGGYQSSVAGDSDVERSDILMGSTDSYKHASFKSQDPTGSFIRGGELPLPSRTPALSTTSSTSSILTSSTSSSTQEGRPSIQSSPSLQSLSRPNVVVSGRTRSGSLGIYGPSSGGRRVQINTHINFNDQMQAVTLIVVGTAGCGKSVAIRKGLKNYDLSEPTPPLPGANASIRYTRRTGRVTQEDGSECPLTVIEVDITDNMLESSISPIDNLPEALKVDGVIICYDASVESSFTPVEDLLRGYRNLQLPVIVLACKSDLDRRVDPETAAEVLQQYDAGLVEVSSNESGKEKMKRSFDWILKAVVRDRRSFRNRWQDNRNPASPELLTTPLLDHGTRTSTPTMTSITSHRQSSTSVIPQPAKSPHQAVGSPTSPTRVRSTGDLPLQHEKSKTRDSPLVVAEDQKATTMRSNSADSLSETRHVPATATNGERASNEKVEFKEKESSRSAQWATLEELLDKLLFLAVSGDDPTYVTHFLLTYRRFSCPRKLLLAMQKRMRQLDNPTGDPIFACFAQMRICYLLELWIGDYPHDFAVRGTAGALSALIKSIISKTYLLHYGSDFLPFLELLPTLVDKDSAWALKADDIADESDDSYSYMEDDDDSIKSEIKPEVPPATPPKKTSSVSAPNRERKSSLPLSAKSLFSGSSNSGDMDSMEFNTKQQLRELVKLANEVNMIDSDEIAQEITRIEKKLFLEIEPRHWLQYTFVSGRKDPETDPIARFNQVSNHLADWVVSLILCHDSVRSRAKQIEKLVEIAQRLRALNNYSALRAFVAGINGSTFPGDETMERFKAKSPDQAKLLQSWDVLLQAIRAHRAYRLALRNTKGACIPALEVHMSDLIRAHEGNEDFNSSDRSKIHWGKFNMMGRFITSTTQCQAQCRSTTDYNFPERPHISALLQSKYVMDDEMQKSRIALSDPDMDDSAPYSGPLSGNSQTKDPARLRRLFPW